MRKVLCLAVVASLVAVSMSASAGGAIDVPRVYDASRDDNYSKATVMCWPIAPNGSRARISCAVAETTIKKPNVAETAKDLAELASAPGRGALERVRKDEVVSDGDRGRCSRPSNS